MSKAPEASASVLREGNPQDEERKTVVVPIKGLRGGEASEAVQAPTPYQSAQAADEGMQQVQGVYIISVAARILEMHPQTLRKYERLGLVKPSRTIGMLRLYSEEDIVRLRVIKHLVDDLGMNLAGVELAMGLLSHLTALRQSLSDLAAEDDTWDSLREGVEEALRLLDMPFP